MTAFAPIWPRWLSPARSTIRRKSSRYGALVAAENANFNIDTYRAANAFEGDLAMRMVKAQGDAAMKAITLEAIGSRRSASPPSAG